MEFQEYILNFVQVNVVEVLRVEILQALPLTKASIIGCLILLLYLSIVYLICQSQGHHISQRMHILKEFQEVRFLISSHDKVERREVLCIVITEILIRNMDIVFLEAIMIKF